MRASAARSVFAALTTRRTTVVTSSWDFIQGTLRYLKAGDKKHVTVTAEDAYGPYDEQKKVTVTKEQVPPEVKVGSRLRAQNGMEAKVLSIDGNSVVVDTNHPLAGKSLVFDINVLKVEKQDAKSGQ